MAEEEELNCPREPLLLVPAKADWTAATATLSAMECNSDLDPDCAAAFTTAEPVDAPVGALTELADAAAALPFTDACAALLLLAAAATGDEVCLIDNLLLFFELTDTEPLRLLFARDPAELPTGATGVGLEPLDAAAVEETAAAGPAGS